MASTFSNWDFFKYHIQEDGLKGGQFMSAESTLVAAGPPTLDEAGGASTAPGTSAASGEPVYPIALLETFGLQQSRQLQRIFEIGSVRSYFIPGRCVGSVTLGRTFYYGPSLLRVLYAYWSGSYDGGGIGEGFTKTGDEALLTSAQTDSLRRAPGYGHLLVDLASDLFARPTGMAIYFKDALSNTYGGFYLEYCYVQGHQMTVSSGSVLIMEGVSVQYDLLVPMDIRE